MQNGEGEDWNYRQGIEFKGAEDLQRMITVRPTRVRENGGASDKMKPNPVGMSGLRHSISIVPQRSIPHCMWVHGGNRSWLIDGY
jgi:hypothetical protein